MYLASGSIDLHTGILPCADKSLDPHYISAGGILKCPGYAGLQLLFIHSGSEIKQGAVPAVLLHRQFDVVGRDHSAHRDPGKILRSQVLPVFCQNVLLRKPPVTVEPLHRLIEPSAYSGRSFRIRPVPMAQDDLSRGVSLRDEEILRLLRDLLLHVRIDNGDQAPRRIPFAQRLLCQRIKKLIRIIDPRGLDDHTIKSRHGHGDQLSGKPAPVREDPVPSLDHFHIAVISHQILQEHHVDIDRSVVILQDSHTKPLIDQELRVFLDKSRLAGSQKAGH